MARKRAARTERRAQERAEHKEARQLVRDRERLAQLTEGGSRDHPVVVPAASVIDGRARARPCPQCAGELRVEAHRAVDGLRALDVRCQQCGVPRVVWFRIVVQELN